MEEEEEEEEEENMWRRRRRRRRRGRICGGEDAELGDTRPGSEHTYAASLAGVVISIIVPSLQSWFCIRL